VQSVINAHRHWEKGELERRWGSDPPHALMLGIETFSRALNAVQSHDIQKRRDDAEAERNKPKPQQGPQPRGRRTLPVRR
jgi:hypothetical protein